jgi:hypothetical protein
MQARWNGTIAPSRMPENATAFAANAGVIDLLACWCGAGWKRPTHSIRRDDCFQDFGTRVLKALSEDGSKIELDQSETTMSDLSGTAAVL